MVVLLFYSPYVAADPLDCMHECISLQTGSCQLFVFQTGSCYLGNANVTNGAVPEKLPNAVVYFLKSKSLNSATRKVLLWQNPKHHLCIRPPLT